MKTQEDAKKLADTNIKPVSKKLLFELVRARNAVLGKCIGGQYKVVYTVYGSSLYSLTNEYLDKFTKKMNQDGYWTKILYKNEEYAVYEISWKSEYTEIDES